jgi:hypothetical protein
MRAANAHARSQTVAQIDRDILFSLAMLASFIIR